MKKPVHLSILILIIATLSGCEKVNLVDSPVKLQSSNSITIAVSKGSSIQSNDTLNVEPGVSITFQAKSNGPEIVTYNWTFYDDNKTSSGEIATHTYYVNTPFVTSIKLVGIDKNNNIYQFTFVVKVIASLDGLPSIQWISSSPQPDGSFNVIMAFHKAYMRFNGSDYFYIGDMTNWNTVRIMSSDTNYTIVNNILTYIPSAEVGKYIVARMSLKTGDYKMGVGKIVDTRNIWGTFIGSYADSVNNTIIKFSVSNSGIVRPWGPAPPPPS